MIFDMRPVWVTGTVVDGGAGRNEAGEPRYWRFTQLNVDGVALWVQHADGVRPEDEAALANTPIGVTITVQLPMYVPNWVRAPFSHVSPEVAP